MNIFTCTNLIAMGRHIPTPFYLSVLDDGAETMLKIESVLRVVPGKRIVAKCIWKNQTVVAKLFFRRGHWKQSMLRDLSGITLLWQAGISTPKVVNQTTTTDKNGAVLMIEFLKQATSMLTLFESANSDEERATIMEMGVATVARCHQAGLWQRDIHLGNFMLSYGKVYVLDGGDIKGDGGTLSRDTCLQNLALFFAQFPVAMDAQIPGLFPNYRKAVNAATDSAAEDATFIEDIRSRVVTERLRRVRNFERKIFRSTTALRLVSTSNRIAVYDRSIHSDTVEEFIRNPDSLLANAKMLKAGNSSTVAMIQLSGRDFVVKRYNVKGFWHGLKRLLQRSRAHHSWRNAAMLEMLGVATPHPFLMIEERLLWLFRRRAWLLSEYINGENLLDQAQNASSEELPVSRITDRFQQLFEVLQTYHISHGDMKASNFIYKDDRVYVLDLDAMHRHRNADAARGLVMKDRERFLRNWNGTVFEPAVQEMLRGFS